FRRLSGVGLLLRTRRRRKGRARKLIAAPDFTDPADLLLELGISQVFDDTGTGDVYPEQAHRIDDRLAGTAHADVRFVAHQRICTVRARARQVDLLRPDLAGDVSADRAGTVEPQPACLKVADFERA